MSADSPHDADGHPPGSGSRGDDGSGGHPGDADSDTGGTPHGRDYSEAPLVVTWEVSQACDLACDHCRAAADSERCADELDLAEARDFFEQVAEFSPQPFLVLSGGDPLKRSDLFEVLETAVEVGVTPSVTPATTERLDRETVERFAEVGVGRMALSLDGATAASHDGFRGEEGTYERAIRAAEAARDVGLSVQVNTTVTAATAGELPEIAEVVEGLGAAMWEVFFLVPTGRGADLEQLSPDRAREVMEWLYRHSRNAPHRVITVEAPFYRRVATEVAREEGHGRPRVGSTGAGNGFVFVSHTGEVYPSGFLPLSAGNVREEPLPEVYRNADLMERLRDRASFVGPCGSCPFTGECGGSRSRAYAATGNPVASDPLCPWAAGD
jgi:radical SAM protein with 4Fe4S-binding SPASM domain